MIADDRGSRIADRKKFCDRLRSSAIVCDQLRSCDDLETKVLRFRPMIQRFLATKPECSLVATVYLLQTWLALNKVTLVARNLWRKLRDMSAFTTVTVKISKTKTKRLTAGKKSGRNLIYQRQRQGSNSAT